MPQEMQNDASEEYLLKISKLLEKAKATDNEHEAALFMGKAQELLLARNLSMESIEGIKKKDKKDVTDTNFDLNSITNRREGFWLRELIWGVAHFNLGKALFSDGMPGNKDDMGSMILIGSPENIQVMKSMITYLVPTIKAWHKRAWSQYNGPDKAGAYKRDFLISCVRRLRTRMREMLEENTKEYQTQHKELGAGEVGSALMVISNKVTEYVENTFGKTSTISGTRSKGRDGNYEGAKAGNSIQFANQIS